MLHAYNISAPWGHYSKWNKPVIERQIMSDYVYMGYVKNQNREENGELFSRYKVSVLKDEKFWRSTAQQCEYT